MDQTILSGIFALGGAVIGGAVTIIATEISNRKQVKLELQKQRIEYLKDSKNALEILAKDVASFVMSPDNQLRIDRMYNQLYLTAHYFNDEPNFKNIETSFSQFVDDYGLFDLTNWEPNALTKIIAEFQELLKSKLCEITMKLKEEMGI